MFSATDYDKLRQIMEESPEKKELLTRLLEAQQITISSISHEIRNPLTLVSGTIQLIESTHPEVTAFRHWDNLRQDLEYMQLLLDDLSLYNNGRHLNYSLIATDAFLKALVLSFAASLTETAITFTSRIEPELPELPGDPLKLRQVILNLLSNARDAVTPSSCTTRNPSIAFHASSDADALILTITDNGCGISEDELPHIFEPFVTHKKNGTGLGLAISTRIVQAHGGTLTVTSIPEISTVFTLTLPV